VDHLSSPFTARGSDGIVSVTIERPTDPTIVGQVADAEGFPVCRATVEFDLDGYDGMLGWVQTVGTKTDTHSDRVFEIDPLQVFEGLELPFAFYGLTPVLFDAPYRSDRSRYLDWVAHSFLCIAPTHPMAKEVEAVTGFSWGFTLKDGEVEVAAIRILQSSDWSRHLADMAESFPNWTFSDSHTW
jgi:hypothetical protein